MAEGETDLCGDRVLSLIAAVVRMTQTSDTMTQDLHTHCISADFLLLLLHHSSICNQREGMGDRQVRLLCTVFATFWDATVSSKFKVKKFLLHLRENP